MPAFLLLTFALTWVAWLAPLPLGGPVFYLGLYPKDQLPMSIGGD